MEVYMRLLDNENFDTIVKACGRKKYEYVFGCNSRWKRIGMLDYYNEDSNKYGKYEEISEQSALKSLAEQEQKLNEIFKQLNERISEVEVNNKELFIYMKNNSNFDSLETAIVSMLFCFGRDFVEKNKQIVGNMLRINNSLETLFSCYKCDNEKQLIELRRHRNTGIIAEKLLEYSFRNKNITKEKYVVLSDFLNQKIVMLDE